MVAPGIPPHFRIRKSSTGILLTWEPAQNSPTTYNVFRGIATGVLSIYAVVGVPTVEYEDIETALDFDNTYYYEVNGENGDGQGLSTPELNITKAPNLPWGIYTTTLPERITITEKKTTMDEYGNPDFYQAVPADARMEYKQKQIKKGIGEVIMSTVQLYVDGTVVVEVDDLVTLTTGEVLPVISVDRKYNGAGTNIMKVIYT